MILADFWDTVSGNEMINFYCKLFTLILLFLVLVFHAFSFTVSGYSLATTKFF